MSNKVEFIGTRIGSAAYAGDEASYGKAKAFDDDYTSFFVANDDTVNHIGIDVGAGKSVIVDQISITAREESYNSASFLNRGAQYWDYKTSDTSATAGLTTRAQHTEFSNRWNYHRQRNIMNVKGAGRFHIITMSLYGTTGLSEVVFIGDFVAGVDCRPMPPVITPGGGRVPNGKAIQITSLTTSATIYYTLDGTTPTTSSTRYIGPFVIKPSGTLTIKAVATDATFSTTSSVVTTAVFTGDLIKPRSDLYDTRGLIFDGHGGHVIPWRNKYWWVGFAMNRGSTGDSEMGSGLHMYSTRDFLTVEYEGQVCQGIPFGVASLDNWQIQRPHILDLTAVNGTFVMWVLAGTGYPGASAHVLTATSLKGPWSLVRSAVTPNSHGYKDGYAVRLSNGKNYLVYAPTSYNSIFITELSRDATQVTSTEVELLWTTGRESPILFEHNSRLWLICSLGNFYSDAQTYDPRYLSCPGNDPITGTWTSIAAAASIFSEGDPLGTIYQGQPTCVFKRIGDNQPFYVSDFWNGPGTVSNLYLSRPTLLPMKFPTATTLRVMREPTFNFRLYPTG